MLERIADKIGGVFSKKAVESAKKAIAEDVEKNHDNYISAAITGTIIAVGIVVATKMILGMIGADSVAETAANITYNYYITITPSTGA